MTDPGVSETKGFFGRLRDFFSGGSDERETRGPTQAEQVQSGGKRRMTSKEAAWWIGGRSPGDGIDVHRRIMEGEIEVVRSDGSIYEPGEVP